MQASTDQKPPDQVLSDHIPPDHAWIRMPSGMRLDLLHPTPFDWSDADLAIRLSRTFRWGGNSIWPHPLSVAQHSLLVLRLRQKDGALSASEALRELLHDAEEGLLGFDAIAPAKRFMGDGFLALNRRLAEVIALRYRLPPWGERAYAAHKRADILAAASEAVHVAGWTHAEVREVLAIRARPLRQDPLPLPPGCLPWEPWSPEQAAQRFLAELERLQARAVAEALPPVEPKTAPRSRAIARGRQAGLFDED